MEPLERNALILADRRIALSNKRPMRKVEMCGQNRTGSSFSRLFGLENCEIT